MQMGDFLRDTAGRLPDKLAMLGDQGSWTYRDLDRQANRVAHNLLGLGLGRGAKIAILSTNRPEYGVAFFGIARTPFVSVHCSTRSSEAELASVLRKTEAQVMIAEARFLPVVRQAIADCGHGIRLYSFDSSADGGDAGLFADLAGSGPDDPPAVELEPADGLAITLTGGTTGFPKAVLVSHGSRVASVQACVREFGLSEHDVMIAATPLFHTAGLFIWFCTGVALGATIVFLESWDPAAFTALVERHGASAAFLVPSQLGSLIGHPGFSPSALASLRNLGYAGSPMGRALYDRVAAALPNVALTENYGQSEACPMTVRRPEHGSDKLGSVGKCAFNAELAVVDREGRFLAAGEIGDIVTRGVQVFDGYFNDPGETADVFRVGDGWLLTGDVGFLDAEGFLTIVDRSRDMLISGAENVYPAEIENALYQHEAVAECAVFGIPDEQWGEVPAAHVVLAPGKTVGAEELAEFCTTWIARFKRPREIRFVDSLPKTPVGKIQKNLLRDPYWAGTNRRI